MKHLVQVRISIWPEGRGSGDPYALVESGIFETQVGARYLAAKLLTEIRRISETESAVEREREKEPDIGSGAAGLD